MTVKYAFPSTDELGATLLDLYAIEASKYFLTQHQNADNQFQLAAEASYAFAEVMLATRPADPEPEDTETPEEIE